MAIEEEKRGPWQRGGDKAGGEKRPVNLIRLRLLSQHWINHSSFVFSSGCCAAFLVNLTRFLIPDTKYANLDTLQIGAINMLKAVHMTLPLLFLEFINLSAAPGAKDLTALL